MGDTPARHRATGIIADVSESMPTDAKCGLLVGVGLVVAAAVLFFRKDSPPAPPAPIVSPAAALKPPAAEPVYPDRTPLPPARPVSRTVSEDPAASRLP
jgi:hypothetical protein